MMTLSFRKPRETSDCKRAKLYKTWVGGTVMKHALIAAVFAVVFCVGTASAQEPIGHCFLNGELLERGEPAKSKISSFIQETNPTGSARMAANLCIDVIVEKSIQVEYSEELQAGVIILDAVNTDGKSYHYTIIVETGSLTVPSKRLPWIRCPVRIRD
jgi:hypothetical protein